MISIVVQHGSRGVAPRRVARHGAFLTSLAARRMARVGASVGPIAVLTAACALACGTLGCESLGGGGGASAPVVDRAGLVGNPAPDFSVAALAGARGSVSLRQLRGKVVLVDFWGTFCTPCKSSFPKLQALNAKYAGSGLQVLGISEDEPEDKGKIPGFVSTYGARFAIGWDEDRSISQHYQPETMPSSFLIDRKGVVRFAHAGYRDGDEAQLEREIQGLLAQ
jgi:cytochrome c biogenesis protein CcmG/thiol:disulfide interchange protein DsbE